MIRYTIHKSSLERTLRIWLVVVLALLLMSDLRSEASEDGDVVIAAQTTHQVPEERPEQKKSSHDLSDVFLSTKAVPATAALLDQADQGQFRGFDLYKDVVGVAKPDTTFEEVYKTLVANRPRVIGKQREILESRYVLEPKLNKGATMSRGKVL